MSYLVIEGFTVPVAVGSSYEVQQTGDTQPAYSGRGRSDVRSHNRVFDITTVEMEADDALALRLLLQSPGPLSCSGDLLDGQTRDCHVSGAPGARPLTATDLVARFRLRETRDTASSVLLFSFDGDAPGLYTFTRTGAAPYFDKFGVLQSAAEDELRTDWVIVDGVAVPAVLLTPAAMNLVSSSEDFSTVFVATNVTVTTNTEVAPDGRTSADNLADSSAAAVGGAAESPITIPDDSLDYCASVFVHKTAHSGHVLRFQLSLFNGTGVSAWVRFDPDTGTIADVSGAVPTDSGVIDYSDDYWRIWAVATNNGTGNNAASFNVQPSYNNDVGSGTADNALQGNQTVWGAQLEQASTPSDYLPTSGSPVDHGAETLTDDPGFTLADAEAAGGVTIYTKWIERGIGHVAGSSTHYWQISDTVNLKLYSGVGGGGAIAAQLTDGVTAATTIPATTVPIDAQGEARLVLFLDGSDWKLQLHVSVNGAAEVSGSASTFGANLPTFDEALITFASSYNAAAQARLHLRSTKVFTGVRTMAACRAMNAARLHARIA